MRVTVPCTHKQMDIYVGMHGQTYRQMCAHTYDVHARMHVHTFTHTHACTCTLTYTHIHAHTYTYIT